MASVRFSKDNGILGKPPPGFPTKEHLVVSHVSHVGHIGGSSRSDTIETVNNSFRVNCTHFDGVNFRGW